MEYEQVILHLNPADQKTLRLALVAWIADMRNIDTGREPWPLEQVLRAEAIYNAMLGGGN